jgi:hypothetical protein
VADAWKPINSPRIVQKYYLLDISAMLHWQERKSENLEAVQTWVSPFGIHLLVPNIVENARQVNNLSAVDLILIHKVVG